ncbi:SGNH/GDSL hydrolase family protein [Anabaena sp. PCC 7108]|uniref:SGNH/GDSL hydrolase family protein n=1 Tax=Anabaena sp. PCC 7108 TaxID=163908 RepID=UPI0003470E71|nr:SGNH/GDSL hydrolase family protein [Anabaena sp. PCC 7108]
MTEPYLLAASLLTGLALPASALPKMSSIPPETTGFLWDLQQDSRMQSGNKIIPSVDISLPEFSSQVASSKNLQSATTQKIVPSLDVLLAQVKNYVLPTPIKSSLNLSSQPTNQIPASGNQLYYLRLASLRMGQIYTRVDDDEDLQASWKSSKKQKLSYEDWKDLLAMEARAISQGQGTNRLSILVGDSLSMWFPKDKLPAGKLWLNQGISGDSSIGVFKRLAAFSVTKPEVIYLMVGINDLLKGASDLSILRTQRLIIRRLRQEHPKSRIIVQSILPIRRTKIPNSRIRHLNTQIAVIAKQEGANYLNIHNWFTDVQGNLLPELTTDGVHLSPEGYDVWRSALQQIEYRVAQRAN